MATTTVQGTERAPHITLSLTLERTHPGAASIADVAAALSVLTALISDQDDAPPIDVVNAHSSAIRSLAVAHTMAQYAVVIGGADGTLRRLALDLDWVPRAPNSIARTVDMAVAHSGAVWVLAVLEYDGAPLIVSGGEDGALRSWRLDGTPGPLDEPAAHSAAIRALAVVDYRGAPLIVSGGGDGALRSWRLDGTPGPLDEPAAHSAAIRALAVVVNYLGASLVVTGGRDGALRSWRLDGTPGPLDVSSAQGGITALLALNNGSMHPVISGGRDGTLRAFALNGNRGEVFDTHESAVRGTHVRGSHRSAEISALAQAEYGRAPLIVVGGRDGELRSFRLTGAPGPLAASRVHRGGISAFAVIDKYGNAPLIMSGGGDGALRSWRVANTLAALEQPAAGEVEVHQLSIGSLQIALQLPADVLELAKPAVLGVFWGGVGILALSRILDALKRVAGFAAELRLQRSQQLKEQVLAEVAVLDALDELEARARHRRRQLQAADWRVAAAVVTDDDSDVP